MNRRRPAAAPPRRLAARLQDGSSVSVALRLHPRYRNIRLSVRSGSKVQLSAPTGTSLRTLTNFLDQQLDWLQQHLPERLPGRSSLPDELELAALAEHWQVRYGNPSGRTTTSGSTLQLPATGGAEARRQLVGWLSRRARRELGSRLGSLSERTGLPYRSLSIRGQRSRWGSYSSSGDVSLNWKMLFLPPELMNYVLLHELCHSRHLDHSADYWATVASFEPRLAELRLAMRDAGRYLPGWLEH